MNSTLFQFTSSLSVLLSPLKTKGYSSMHYTVLCYKVVSPDEDYINNFYINALSVAFALPFNLINIPELQFEVLQM